MGNSQYFSHCKQTLNVRHYRLEEAGEIHAAVQCYQEALADDPDLESPKRRLHYLEAQVLCSVNVTSTMISRVCLKKFLLFSLPPCLWLD